VKNLKTEENNQRIIDLQKDIERYQRDYENLFRIKDTLSINFQKLNYDANILQFKIKSTEDRVQQKRERMEKLIEDENKETLRRKSIKDQKIAKIESLKRDTDE